MNILNGINSMDWTLVASFGVFGVLVILSLVSFFLKGTEKTCEERGHSFQPRWTNSPTIEQFQEINRMFYLPSDRHRALDRFQTYVCDVCTHCGLTTGERESSGFSMHVLDDAVSRNLKVLEERIETQRQITNTHMSLIKDLEDRWTDFDERDQEIQEYNEKADERDQEFHTRLSNLEYRTIEVTDLAARIRTLEQSAPNAAKIEGFPNQFNTGSPWYVPGSIQYPSYTVGPIQYPSYTVSSSGSGSVLGDVSTSCNPFISPGYSASSMGDWIDLNSKTDSVPYNSGFTA